MGYQMAGNRGPESYIFEAGIAAHHILQAIGEATNANDAPLEVEDMETVARAVCEQLISEGRSFDGVPEPPLSHDRVWEGRDVALDYIASHPIRPGARYELGLAVTDTWEPCEYDDDRARFRCILDVVQSSHYEDEETSSQILTIRDYKSSWATDAASVDRLQQRAQAIVADIHYPGAEILTIEVVNLRTWATYSKDLYLGAEGREVLDEWRADLGSTMDSFDAMREGSDDDQWPATPGHGCAGCPYLTICDAAREWVTAYDLEYPENAAIRYAVLDAERKRLGAWLKRATEDAAIEIDGAIVGTVALSMATPQQHAPSHAWDEWEVGNGDGPGFARAIGLTAGNLRTLAKTLYPAKEMAKDRDAFLDQVITTKRTRRFGIHKKESE
jgi:hypothetical protein